MPDPDATSEEREGTETVTMPKRSRGKTILKVLAIVVVSLALLGGGAFFFLERAVQPGPVADYDSRVEIWETVAGNSDRSKLDEMNIDYDAGSLAFASIAFANGIVGDTYKDSERAIDTFTYLYEIEGGFEKETFEDEPYLIPYVVEDSQSAVIVIPGGGYGYKSMDGSTYEGKDVALALNDAGISAFVLHYRSNPYEFPLPQLDVQRAVRYLRFHASDYGFSPQNIGLLGFSAGGYQTGSFINLVMGNDLFPEGYEPDEIDQVDDSVIAGGMIYPALTYRYNVPMLFASFDAALVRDETEREHLLDQTDLSLHINSVAIPQFIAYGTEDGMVNMEGIQTYIAAANEAGATVEVVEAEGQDHGFAQEYYMDDFLTWFNAVLSARSAE